MDVLDEMFSCLKMRSALPVTFMLLGGHLKTWFSVLCRQRSAWMKKGTEQEILDPWFWFTWAINYTGGEKKERGLFSRNYSAVQQSFSQAMSFPTLKQTTSILSPLCYIAEESGVRLLHWQWLPHAAWTFSKTVPATLISFCSQQDSRLWANVLRAALNPKMALQVQFVCRITLQVIYGSQYMQIVTSYPPK